MDIEYKGFTIEREEYGSVMNPKGKNNYMVSKIREDTKWVKDLTEAKSLIDMLED